MKTTAQYRFTFMENSQMTSFDPDSFLTQTIDKPLETEFAQVPEGEYTAVIDDFDSGAVQQIQFTYKNGPRAGTPGTMVKLNLPFVIQDDAIKTEMQRDKVVVEKQVILDTDKDGGLDWGKNRNIDLGRIRAAVGQNDPGPWSLDRLRGAGPVVVKVTHVPFERKDGSKGSRVEVSRVVRIA